MRGGPAAAPSDRAPCPRPTGTPPRPPSAACRRPAYRPARSARAPRAFSPARHSHAHRRGWPARSSPIRSDRRAAGCRRRQARSGMPSWARVCRSALSARASASASSRGSELDQRIADADLAADLHEDGADDARGFGADLRLVGREQRAGEIHLPLDRDALRSGGLDGDGRTASPTVLARPGIAASRDPRADDRQRGTRENPVCDCHGPTAEMRTVSR